MEKCIFDEIVNIRKTAEKIKFYTENASTLAKIKAFEYLFKVYADVERGLAPVTDAIESAVETIRVLTSKTSKRIWLAIAINEIVIDLSRHLDEAIGFLYELRRVSEVLVSTGGKVEKDNYKELSEAFAKVIIEVESNIEDTKTVLSASGRANIFKNSRESLESLKDLLLGSGALSGEGRALISQKISAYKKKGSESGSVVVGWEKGDALPSDELPRGKDGLSSIIMPEEVMMSQKERALRSLSLFRMYAGLLERYFGEEYKRTNIPDLIEKYEKRVTVDLRDESFDVSGIKIDNAKGIPGALIDEINRLFGVRGKNTQSPGGIMSAQESLFAVDTEILSLGGIAIDNSSSNVNGKKEDFRLASEIYTLVDDGNPGYRNPPFPDELLINNIAERAEAIAEVDEAIREMKAYERKTKDINQRADADNFLSAVAKANINISRLKNSEYVHNADYPEIISLIDRAYTGTRAETDVTISDIASWAITDIETSMWVAGYKAAGLLKMAAPNAGIMTTDLLNKIDLRIAYMERIKDEISVVPEYHNSEADGIIAEIKGLWGDDIAKSVRQGWQTTSVVAKYSNVLNDSARVIDGLAGCLNYCHSLEDKRTVSMLLKKIKKESISFLKKRIGWGIAQVSLSTRTLSFSVDFVGDTINYLERLKGYDMPKMKDYCDGKPVPVKDPETGELVTPPPPVFEGIVIGKDSETIKKKG